MSNPNDGYPLLTSTDSTGDVTTAGFIADILATIDPVQNPADDSAIYVGQPTSTGTDKFYGQDFVHPEHIEQLPDELHKQAATARIMGQQVERALMQEHKDSHNPFVAIRAPQVVGTGSVYFAAPNGTASAVTSFKILNADPSRYRITLHPWTASGTVGQLWIGRSQGDVSQAANGQPVSAFPLDTGGAAAQNMSSFYWADDMWVAIDINATVNSYLFWVIERYV